MEERGSRGSRLELTAGAGEGAERGVLYPRLRSWAPDHLKSAPQLRTRAPVPRAAQAPAHRSGRGRSSAPPLTPRQREGLPGVPRTPTEGSACARPRGAGPERGRGRATPLPSCSRAPGGASLRPGLRGYVPPPGLPCAPERGWAGAEPCSDGSLPGARAGPGRGWGAAQARRPPRLSGPGAPARAPRGDPRPSGPRRPLSPPRVLAAFELLTFCQLPSDERNENKYFFSLGSGYSRSPHKRTGEGQPAWGWGGESRAGLCRAPHKCPLETWMAGEGRRRGASFRGLSSPGPEKRGVGAWRRGAGRPGAGVRQGALPGRGRLSSREPARRQAPRFEQSPELCSRGASLLPGPADPPRLRVPLSL